MTKGPCRKTSMFLEAIANFFLVKGKNHHCIIPMNNAHGPGAILFFHRVLNLFNLVFRGDANYFSRGLKP